MAGVPSQKASQIKEDLMSSGADIFAIAAEAIERGDRLALQVSRLEKTLRQIKLDPVSCEAHCSGLCQPQ